MVGAMLVVGLARADGILEYCNENMLNSGASYPSDPKGGDTHRVGTRCGDECDLELCPRLSVHSQPRRLPGHGSNLCRIRADGIPRRLLCVLQAIVPRGYAFSSRLSSFRKR